MLRRESAHQDVEGRPIITRAEDRGGSKYTRAFDLLRNWIESGLDLYKAELRRLLWPVFVYSFLSLPVEFYIKDCEDFYHKYKDLFAAEHQDDLRALSAIRIPEHLGDSHIAKLYRTNRYRITLSNIAFNNLLNFLELKDTEGGSVILFIINNFMNLVTIDRALAGPERSIAAILARGAGEADLPGEDEGIPGHHPGSANLDRNAPANVLARLQLGPLPPENDLSEDVRSQLQDRDAKDPPKPGQNSLLDEYEQRIKREPADDMPNREIVPLPPSLARDVAMEIQKVVEHRDRFRISGRTGGVGPGISVTMFTFHNTFDWYVGIGASF